MNRQKLIKNILDEIYRIRQEKGIDILHMPDKERIKWIDHLVRQFWE